MRVSTRPASAHNSGAHWPAPTNLHNGSDPSSSSSWEAGGRQGLRLAELFTETERGQETQRVRVQRPDFGSSDGHQAVWPRQEVA